MLKINLVECQSVQSALTAIPVGAVWVMEDYEYADPRSGRRWSVNGESGAVSALHRAHRARKAGAGAF